MPRMKVEIIVLFQNLGDDRPFFARSPAPPLSGLLLAALTPDLVDVSVRHEMVRPIDYDTEADVVALSFMDYCAPHARQVARRFRQRGKITIAGGRYASTFPRELIDDFDCVVAGEAEGIWARVVTDLVHGRLQKFYQAPLLPCLHALPAPRYDLAEPQFSVPVVTEATRGCPFRCTYCQLTIQNAPFRMRPIPDVIRDLTATQKLPWWKRRLAMIYDNNLGGNIGYAKELLSEIARLDLWALGVQFSLNNLRDQEFVDLLEKARCRMVFLGMESLSEASLSGVNKNHNRVSEYRERFLDLKRRGILTFAGTMLGLDGDTADDYRDLPVALEQVDPSAIFLSLSIPIPGTPLHRQMEWQGRIEDRDLAHYDGDHLVFTPLHVSREETLEAFRTVNRRFYSWSAVVRRWGRLMQAFLGQRSGGGALRRLAPALLISGILFQLSIFQRGHMRRRVLPLARESRPARRLRLPEPAARTAR